MTFSLCLFAARADGDQDVEELRRRALRLCGFYGVPTSNLVFQQIREARGVIGAIGADDRAPRHLVWGTSPPAQRADLRHWTGPGVAASAQGASLTAITATVDVASLYAMGDRAWSTHAVAAAYLGRGVVEIRPDALAELLAFEHPAGGGGSVVAGVETAPPAAEIVVSGERPTSTSYWPREARWSLPAGDAPYDAVEDALMEHVRRLPRDGPVALGLTGGLDSRVAAAALVRCGVPYTAYTWGRPTDPDVVAARAVARALGVEHRVVSAEWLGDEDGLTQAIHASRWSDGTAPFGFAARDDDALPPGAVNVTGIGGELGRAFHYAYLARNWSDPTVAQLRKVWRPEKHLPAAMPRSARDAVQSAADAALAAAADLPDVRGWRILDIIYSELRMRWWTRVGIRPTAGSLVPLFLAPRVAAALVALPLEERLSAGFHRWYLAARAPELRDLPLPPARAQRGGVPPAARRAAASVRGFKRRPRVYRDHDVALHRPRTLAYLQHEVARSPLLRDALGERFSAELLADLERQDPAAIGTGLALAAPVSLAQSLVNAGLAA